MISLDFQQHIQLILWIKQRIVPELQKSGLQLPRPAKSGAVILEMEAIICVQKLCCLPCG